MPPQIAMPRRSSTQRRELGTYTPRRFTPRCRERFLRDRRRRYLSRISGAPSGQQAALIMTLGSLEWSALEAESRNGDIAAAREAREHRRLFQRLLTDFERSIPPPPGERPPTLSDLFRADRPEVM